MNARVAKFDSSDAAEACRNKRIMMNAYLASFAQIFLLNLKGSEGALVSNAEAMYRLFFPFLPWEDLPDSFLEVVDALDKCIAQWPGELYDFWHEVEAIRDREPGCGLRGFLAALVTAGTGAFRAPRSRLRSSPPPSTQPASLDGSPPSPESPELIARSFPTAPAVLSRLSQQQQQRRPARPALRPPQAPPPSAPSAPAPASSSSPVATGLAASLRLAKPSAALSAFFSSTRSSGSSSPLAAAPLPPAASLLSHTLGPSLPASLAHPRRSSWRPTPYRQALQKGDKAWVPDEHTLSCLLCKKPFTLLFRRHHCRCCGKLVCDECSARRVALGPGEAPSRVCSPCADMLLADQQLLASSPLREFQHKAQCPPLTYLYHAFWGTTPNPTAVGELYVQVLAGRNLPVLDLFSSDPYCRVTLKEQEHSTPVQYNTLDPVWTQRNDFCFTVHNVTSRLTVAAWDKDATSADDLMGTVTISLDTLAHQLPCEQWFELELADALRGDTSSGKGGEAGGQGQPTIALGEGAAKGAAKSLPEPVITQGGGVGDDRATSKDDHQNSSSKQKEGAMLRLRLQLTFAPWGQFFSYCWPDLPPPPPRVPPKFDLDCVYKHLMRLVWAVLPILKAFGWPVYAMGWSSPPVSALVLFVIVAGWRWPYTLTVVLQAWLLLYMGCQWHARRLEASEQLQRPERTGQTTPSDGGDKQAKAGTGESKAEQAAAAQAKEKEEHEVKFNRLLAALVHSFASSYSLYLDWLQWLFAVVADVIEVIYDTCQFRNNSSPVVFGLLVCSTLYSYLYSFADIFGVVGVVLMTMWTPPVMLACSLLSGVVRYRNRLRFSPEQLAELQRQLESKASVGGGLTRVRSRRRRRRAADDGGRTQDDAQLLRTASEKPAGGATSHAPSLPRVHSAVSAEQRHQRSGMAAG